MQNIPQKRAKSAVQNALLARGIKTAASIGIVMTFSKNAPPLPELARLLVGIIPNPYASRKERDQMMNRTRGVPVQIYLTESEKALIEQKMKMFRTRNFSAYARKMLIDGYIVNVDYADIKAQTAEIQKIGVNVNQIAKRLNAGGDIYAQDIEDIKGALAEIWRLQRLNLSKAP